MKFKLWRSALLFAFATLAMSFSASAQEPSELRCRGNDNPLVDIFVFDKLDADTLSLNFNASPRAAGPDSKGLAPGTCSWIDRTVKEDEWRQVHFVVTAAQAESIPAHLKNPKNYWSFFVITSDRGYFEAKSHKVWTVETKQETSAMPSPNESQPNTPPAQPNTPPAQPNTPPAQPNTPPAQPNTPPAQPNTPPAQPNTPPAQPNTPPAQPNTTPAQPSAPPASFAGTWDTVAGGDYKYTMKLEQAGDKVTGTFSPGGGKLEGTVTANVLRLHFTQNPNFKGSARLVLADDGQKFSGTTNAGDDPDANGQDWIGKKQTASVDKGAPVSFTGTWEIVANTTNKFVVILKQTGDKVTGTFDPGNGKILNGVVEGNMLDFEWTQDGGYVGAGRWNLGANPRSLSGSMYIFDGPTKGVVPTTGTRNIRLRVP